MGEVDPLGNLTSSPKYDVYGAVRANGGTASSKQGFVGGLGHCRDPETGLIYMRARYYDPQRAGLSAKIQNNMAPIGSSTVGTTPSTWWMLMEKSKCLLEKQQT